MALFVRASLSLATIVALAGPAAAHVEIRYPAQRTNQQKSGPCGAPSTDPAYTRGTNVSYFLPGETITVQFDETVGHTGHYRIAFDDDGQDFQDPVTDDDGFPETMIEFIDDPSGSQGVQTAEITFPNIECDNCTLQLIQVMDTTPPYVESSLYFQCADIVLTSTPPTDAGPDTGGGGGDGPDSGPDTGGGGGGDGDGSGGGAAPTGGCSSGGAPVGLAAALFAAAAALAASRRRAATSRRG